MNTVMKTKSTMRKAYVPKTALASSVDFDSSMMHVFLSDGRVVTVQIIWFPCSQMQRRNNARKARSVEAG